MKLVWTRSAKADRRGIYAYIARDNPDAALALDQLFLKKALRLLDYPQMGRQGRALGTRELVAHPNYIPIYGVTKHAIYILHVLHAARQWP